MNNTTTTKEEIEEIDENDDSSIEIKKVTVDKKARKSQNIYLLMLEKRD
jgi:hypothetical protein